jgi:prepilin-type N-terminal cleavage/methylation domain-containing protein
MFRPFVYGEKMRQPRQPAQRYKKGGFTLLELAIVLAVLGLLLGGGSLLLQPMLDNNRRNETKARLKVIEDALTVYAAQNFDLPCPSNPALGPSSASNGAEGSSCSSVMEFGGVPWRAMGLSEADVLDGWGRRISYAVTSDLAVASGGPLNCPSLGFGATPPGINQGRLENRGANDAAIPPSGNAAGPAKAAYVLISHGENGSGAFLPSGQRLPDGPASATEIANRKTVGGGTDTVFYYEKRTSDTDVGFDDIVRSRTSGQIAIAYGCVKP